MEVKGAVIATFTISAQAVGSGCVLFVKGHSRQRNRGPHCVVGSIVLQIKGRKLRFPGLGLFHVADYKPASKKILLPKIVKLERSIIRVSGLRIIKAGN